MIDEVNFDTSNAPNMIDQGWEPLPPIETESPPHVDEMVPSARSSHRKMRKSLIALDYSSAKRESDLKAVFQSPPIHASATNGSISSSNTDNISASLKKYFFEKMDKKGIHEAEKVYDLYLNAGFSPKAAIALTDRKFFPNAHEKDHGKYLKNVVGDEFFKKEQAARKGKNDWIADEKVSAAAIKAFVASVGKSTGASGKSKKHEYKNKSPGLGGYLLGVAEIIAGGAIMVAGGALEIATCGGFTVGLGVTMGTGASLIGLGLATTAANAQNISIPKFPKYDPHLDIVNKPKEKPKKWDESGSPPIRGDHIVGDGKTSPGQGFNEWKGRGDPASGKGSWVRGRDANEETLHPDFNHPIHGSHWDYKGPWGEARIYPNGTWEPK